MKKIMLKNVKKISIIGGPGTGKSTLADNFGKQLNLPVYHIDGINYFPNWVQRDKEERDKIILEKVNTSEWIMDGTYKSTLDTRISNSDLVIFLNYTTFARLKGIFSRYLKNRREYKYEIPGCKEQMNWTLIKLTVNWKNKRKLIYGVLNKNNDKEILEFKTRRSLNRWYKENFGDIIKT